MRQLPIRQIAAYCVIIVWALVVSCAAADAQALEKKVQADYANVQAWARSVAQIINAHKCISEEVEERIQRTYIDVLYQFSVDAQALLGRRESLLLSWNVDPTAATSKWVARWQHETTFALELLAQLRDLICRPPYWPGEKPQLYLDIVFPKTLTSLGIEETSDATGKVTNTFNKKRDPLGIGVGFGYIFAPWNNNVRVSLFGSLEYLHQTINQTFVGGTFLGTTTAWIGTLGAKLGFVTTPGVFVYGLAGVSFLNETMNINFGGPITSQTTTIPGFTAGLGGEYRPAFLQKFGRPVSLFLQYQHTWWQDAHLKTPAASPLFNYAFKREDDTLRFGVKVYFADLLPQSTAPARPIITK